MKIRLISRSQKSTDTSLKRQLQNVQRSLLIWFFSVTHIWDSILPRGIPRLTYSIPCSNRSNLLTTASQGVPNRILLVSSWSCAESPIYGYIFGNIKRNQHFTGFADFDSFTPVFVTIETGDSSRQIYGFSFTCCTFQHTLAQAAPF